MARYDILLIGDGTDLLKTIGWVLDYKGFAVKVTASPEAALEALVKKNYDLVIAKFTTADMESLEILKRAKQLNLEVKIMVVSGNDDAIFPLEVYQVEVDDYLLMPVNPTELWRRVSHCLEDREVVDLQPVKGSAACSGTSALAKPQMMLMLHDIRGSMISTAAWLKLMARGTHGAVSAPARAKLLEAAGRIEKTIHLTEDFIGKSLADRRPGARAEDLLDLTADIVEPVLAELAVDIQNHQITLPFLQDLGAEIKLVVATTIASKRVAFITSMLDLPRTRLAQGFPWIISPAASNKHGWLPLARSTAPAR